MSAKLVYYMVVRIPHYYLYTVNVFVVHLIHWLLIILFSSSPEHKLILSLPMQKCKQEFLLSCY